MTEECKVCYIESESTTTQPVNCYLASSLLLFEHGGLALEISLAGGLDLTLLLLARLLGLDLLLVLVGEGLLIDLGLEEALRTANAFLRDVDMGSEMQETLAEDLATTISRQQGGKRRGHTTLLSSFLAALRKMRKNSRKLILPSKSSSTSLIISYSTMKIQRSQQT